MSWGTRFEAPESNAVQGPVVRHEDVVALKVALHSGGGHREEPRPSRAEVVNESVVDAVGVIRDQVRGGGSEGDEAPIRRDRACEAPPVGLRPGRGHVDASRGVGPQVADEHVATAVRVPRTRGADDWKTTRWPSAETAPSPGLLWASACPPEAETLTRCVVPVRRLRANTSNLPLVSCGMRFVARDPNATRRPLADSDTAALTLLPCEPDVDLLTSRVLPVPEIAHEHVLVPAVSILRHEIRGVGDEGEVVPVRGEDRAAAVVVSRPTRGTHADQARSPPLQVAKEYLMEHAPLGLKRDEVGVRRDGAVTTPAVDLLPGPGHADANDADRRFAPARRRCQHRADDHERRDQTSPNGSHITSVGPDASPDASPGAARPRRPPRRSDRRFGRTRRCPPRPPRTGRRRSGRRRPEG